MQALKGRIPRVLRNHKTPEGWVYGQYCRGILARLGPLPPDARPTLKEAGLTAVDLMRVRQDLERARARNYRKAIRRYSREIHHLRCILMQLERRLEERVGIELKDEMPDFATLLAMQSRRDGEDD